MSSTVTLYVYDLTQGMARQLSQQILGQSIEGVWHTGVVVFGFEYFYGGGIQYDSPGRTPFGAPVKRLDFGTTNLTQESFHQFLQSISHKYTMETYNILTHNCNNFSNEVLKFLTGSPVPPDILDLPTTIMNSPFGSFLRPMLDQMQNQLSHFQASHSVSSPADQQQPVTPESLHVPRFNVPPNQATHPHMSLKFQMLSQWHPVLFQTGNLPAIKSKLLQNIQEVAPTCLTKEDEAHVQHLFAVLQEAKPVRGNQQTYALIEKLIAVMPASHIFPLLDLFRLLIASTEIAEHYITKQMNILKDLITKFGSNSEEIPRAARLMTVRLVANCFCTPTAKTLVSEAHVESIIQLFLNSINSDAKQEKTAAAVLVYNMSLFLPRSDFEPTTQCIVAILHHLQEEQSEQTDAEAQFTLLMALGHLLYTNDDGVVIVQSLGLNLTRWTNGPSTTSPKLAGIAKDIQSLIN